MNEKLHAIFEVKNERATQTSAALPHTLARNLYDRDWETELYLDS